MKKNAFSTISGIGCFLLVWGIILAPLDFWLGHSIWQQWKTSFYREATGTITHSSVEYHCNIDNDKYLPKVQYDYVVDGKKFTGETYKLTLADWSKESAYRLVHEFPVGKTVLVYYPPGMPESPVLRKGIEAVDLIFLFFLLPFNSPLLFGIYGFMKFKFGRRFRREKKYFRSIPLRDDGLVLRLKVGYADPIPVGIGMLTLVGFIATIVAYLFFKDRFDWNSCLILLGMGVMGFLAGYLLVVWSNHSKHNELVIDRMRGVLILPRQSDNSTGPAVPFDAIESLAVSVRRRKSDEESDERLLTVLYRDEGEEKSAVAASDRYKFLSFNSCDSEEEMEALKNLVLYEMGKTNVTQGKLT